SPHLPSPPQPPPLPLHDALPISAAQREQVSLLPPSRAPLAVREIQDRYPDHHLLTDEVVDAVAGHGGTLSPLSIANPGTVAIVRSEEHTSELQSLTNLVSPLLLE